MPKYSQDLITSCHLHFPLVQVTIISYLIYTISFLTDIIAPSPNPSPPHSAACVIFCKRKSDHVSPLHKTPHVTWSKSPNPHNSRWVTCFTPPLPVCPPSLPRPLAYSLRSTTALEHTRHPLARVSYTCFSLSSQIPTWLTPPFPSDLCSHVTFSSLFSLATLCTVTSLDSHTNVPQSFLPT